MRKVVVKHYTKDLAERERLSQLHLPIELKKALSEIDEQAISTKKKTELKRALIREQVNTWKR